MSRVHGNADPCPRLAPLLNMITAWRKWSNQSVALTFAVVVKESLVVGNRVDVVRFWPVRSTLPNLPGFVFRDRRILLCQPCVIFLWTLSICRHCKNKIHVSQKTGHAYYASELWQMWIDFNIFFHSRIPEWTAEKGGIRSTSSRKMCRRTTSRNLNV